jgi:NAD+ kinase
VEDARACSLVFALGGDGTALRALALAAPAGTPVLGVNFGRLGFLTEVAAEQLEPALRLIDERRATIEDRAALRAELITARGLLGSYAAYNDAVLSRTPGRGPAAVAVQVQGTLFARYACDAVLISTATGSTAYNFAAGGPLVAPQVNAVVVTPVAPHGPFNRSLVVDAGHISFRSERPPTSARSGPTLSAASDG